MKKRESYLIQIISSKLFIVAGLAVLIFLGVSLSKEISRRFEISSRVKGLKNEIATLEKENKEISGLIEYLKSETYREKQARLKLGLQKEGESLVILPKETSQTKDDESEEGPSTEREQEKESAPQKWWNYFFNK